MVKFGFILKLLCASTLLSVVASEKVDECDEIFNYVLTNENVSYKECSTDSYGRVTELEVTGNLITQDVIDKLSIYKTLKKLQFTRVEVSKDLNMESFYLNNFIYHDISGGNNNTFRGNHIKQNFLKTLKHVNNVKLTGFIVSQDNINDLANLTKTYSIEFEDCQFDDNIDYSLLKAQRLSFTTLLGGNMPNAFPESLCNNKNIINLRYTNGKMTSIPECIGNLKYLENLDLSNNQITQLPQSFKKLYKIGNLNLSGNEISDINGLCTSYSLLQLKLNSNKIESLPNCIGNLSKLLVLELANNKIPSLPFSFKELSNLNALDLSSNAITSIPRNFLYHKNLEQLNLSHNSLNTFPLPVLNIGRLVKLQLGFNQITRIPVNIQELYNLKEFDLSNNSIINLPKNLGQLYKLEDLDLSNNKIDDTIPESLNYLTKLRSINLSNNVDIKGKTLTIPGLLHCEYNIDHNATKDNLCLSPKSVCKPTQSLPTCQ